MRNHALSLMVILVVLCGGGNCLAAEKTIRQTDRGASVETDRYKAEIKDGVLVGFFNKLTQEEYLNARADLGNILPYLPSGLGTVHGEEASLAARALVAQPWWEHPYKNPREGYGDEKMWEYYQHLYKGSDEPNQYEMYMPNQHRPTAESDYAFTAQGDNQATLTYTGLSDGKKHYAEETFGLHLEVEAETGDLLLTPMASSPQKGVYGANLTVTACAPGIAIEAPIWDGLHITPEAWPVSMWHNMSGYWDYGFLALSGSKKGAVGLWVQDKETRYYRSFFYLNNEEGLSFSTLCYNIPPFEEKQDAKTLPWHLQAFDTSWMQAVERYQDWRQDNVRIAARPDWASEISFVMSGPPGAQKQWAETINNYFEHQNLERVVVWAATVRKHGFDDAHWDNTPYDGFKTDMKVWKETTRAKLMPYLQPMIVWALKTQPPEDARWIMDMHWDANTLRPENAAFPRPVDVQQHNLAHAKWTDWFLTSWVNSYIQEYGAQGIYHDQTTYCPIDKRPADERFGGKTAVQGMADYFYRAQAANPDSIHASEHLWESNITGASLGIGAGRHWGAGKMRELRIYQSSPVTAALHRPYGKIFSFPHQSDFASHCDVVKAHEGMNLMERRAMIAGTPIININLYSGKVAPFSAWVNELAIVRKRDTTFVHKGLNPHFPVDWDREVLSYFEGVEGGQFRYESRPWGSAFVEVSEGGKEMLYGRIFAKAGKSAAIEKGGVYGWVCHNESGPSGLHPDFGYCVSPAVKRPKAWFQPTGPKGELAHSYVADGFANDYFACLSVRPLDGKQEVMEQMRLVADMPIEAVYVNGAPVSAQDIRFKAPAEIVAVFKSPTVGLAGLSEGAALRMVLPDKLKVDIFAAEWLSDKIKIADKGDGAVELGQSFRAHYRRHQFERYFAFKAPAAGQVHLTGPEKGLRGLTVNGRAIDVASPEGAKLTLQEGETVVVQISASAAANVKLAWVPGR